jgi:hypothetical protein
MIGGQLYPEDFDSVNLNPVGFPDCFKLAFRAQKPISGVVKL